MEVIISLVFIAIIISYWRKILSFFFGLGFLGLLCWGVYWFYVNYTTQFWWTLGGGFSFLVLIGAISEYNEKKEIRRNVVELVGDDDIDGLADYYLAMPYDNRKKLKESVSSLLSSMQKKILLFSILKNQYGNPKGEIIFDEREADLFINRVADDLLSRKIVGSFSFMQEIIAKYFSSELEIERQNLLDERNSTNISLVIIREILLSEEDDPFKNAILLD